jgi:predicted nucleotidyltransferase
MKRLFLFTVDETRKEYKFLSDEELEKVVEHLYETDYEFLRINNIYDKHKEFIKEITDKETIDSVKVLKPYGNIYEIMMNCWKPEHLNININKIKERINRKSKIILTRSDCKIIDKYFKNQISRNNKFLYNKNNVEKIDLNNDNTSKFLETFSYTMSDFKINETVPHYISNRKIDKSNKKKITELIVFMNEETKQLNDFLYPRIANSFTHIDFMQTNNAIKWLETNYKLVNWNLFLRIYHAYEKLEKQYNFTCPSYNKRVIDLDFAKQFISKNDIPDWGINENTKTIKPDIIPGIVSINEFWDRFHSKTENAFKPLLNLYLNTKKLKSIKKNKKTKFYFCGSIVSFCAVKGSLKYKKQYKDSDIDIVVYAKNDETFDNWVNNTFLKVFPAECDVKRVETTKGFHKWHLYRKDNGQKIEIFKSSRNLIALISSFHLPCVRAFIDKNKIYCFASFIKFALTGINNDFNYLNTIHNNRLDLCVKYKKRGNGFNFNEKNYNIVIQKFKELNLPY